MAAPKVPAFRTWTADVAKSRGEATLRVGKKVIASPRVPRALGDTFDMAGVSIDDVCAKTKRTTLPAYLPAP